MNKVKVEGLKIRTLYLLNDEWTVEMKDSFLEYLLETKIGLIFVSQVDKKLFPITAELYFEKAIDFIEKRYDDLLLRMYLCYRFPDTFGSNDEDLSDILELFNAFRAVISDEYTSKFKFPRLNSLTKQNKKPATSILIATFLYDFNSNNEHLPFKELDSTTGLNLFLDIPEILFATSYKKLYTNFAESILHKQLAAQNEIAKLTLTLDKQKEDVQKLKKANIDLKKETAKEFEPKIQKLIVENKELKRKLTDLEKEKQQNLIKISETLQERDDYKIKWNKEVEKNANFEVLKANLIKEKEEFQSIKREYSELKNNQQYQYTERDWVSGIFSIFMNNKAELLKTYKESLILLNKELNQAFNEPTSPSSTSSVILKDDNDVVKVTETQNKRKSKNLIGYVELVNGEWCVNNNKITPLNSQQILVENMFVLVDENYKILSSLNAELIPERMTWFTNTKTNFYCYRKNGKYFDADGVQVEPIFKYPNKNIKELQVLLLNEKNEVLTVLPRMLLNIDKIMPFVKKSDLEIVILKHKIEGFLIATDVLTQEDRMLKFDNLDLFRERLDVDSTIIFKGNEIQSTFRSPLFYKMSSYYTDKETAIVIEVVNQDYFVEKTNGEIVMIKDNYSNYVLSIGDVVTIDKNNNFIYKEDSSEIVEDTNKPFNFRKKIKSYKEKASAPITDNVLIIGNPKHKISYELGMRRNGVQAEVIDGYSSYFHVKKKMNDYDKVVVISSFVSHDNMFKIKNEFASKNIFYPEKDGVNYIYEMISK